ncbi:hypothetical protein E3G52_000332 [Mycobacteroides abscessus]|uniref:hypothetical protein n=1 Tax=Mycobacteroides abscessus TaxID=36809 RepID=UPI001C6C005D|nr:hypothetical protein [Mycobacteroides abscessus]MBE5453468.1 hypothetical protein [Mycobacteroides abscessus]
MTDTETSAADGNQALLAILDLVGSKLAKDCPLCGTTLTFPLVRNSLSRFIDTYICNRCGTGEALLNITRRRVCLYWDEVMGIALVEAHEPGYYPFATPASAEFADGYVAAVNKRIGITPAEALDIVASSMAVSHVIEK